jgi:dimethylargininase
MILPKDERLFDTVFVRPPSERYRFCVSSNPNRYNIDVGLAKKQHEQYVTVLRSCGISVMKLGSLPEFPDSVFMQDPGIIGRSEVVICRFGEKSRAGEVKVFVEELKSQHITKDHEIKFISDPGTLEAGDVLITPDRFLVGQSGRSNQNGIRQFADIVRNKSVEPVRTELLHLLAGCTYLSNQTILIAPSRVDIQSFAGFRFVQVPREEAYAANALYAGEGRVVMPSGFPRTRSKLVEEGYRPEEVDLSEFQKGDGSVTCLCSPLYKSIL